MSGKFGVDVYEWRPWSSSAGFPVVGEGWAQEDKTGNKLFLISGPENALVGAVFEAKRLKADLSELWQLLHILELLSSFYNRDVIILYCCNFTKATGALVTLNLSISCLDLMVCLFV